MHSFVYPMKLNRTYLFIIISSFALCIVLVIQVNWILKTAKIKEDLFNEKANIVLSKTAEAIAADTSTIKRLELCIDKDDVQRIDSLFHHYMNFYNIHVDYFFEVQSGSGAPEVAGSFPGSLNKITSGGQVTPGPRGSFKACVGGSSPAKPGVNLKLVFPDKKQFIIAEMGPMFITSVILILVVMVMSWRTMLSLMKEKKISEHTTDFLNNMTHEFKTPLTNIALAGKMLVKETNIGQEDKIRQYSEIIREENDKLRLQVEQVLSMTALERGEIPIQKTELEMHQLIHYAIKCINIQIENKLGHVELKPEAENSVVMGDKTHLTNALCNLIDNAIKYTIGPPDISITTSNNNRYFIMKISDRGIGIEKKYQEKVFDKFFRVPTGNVHNVKGFGLGLSYIKKIFELHGGSITLQSEKNKGTIFTITLPNV